LGNNLLYGTCCAGFLRLTAENGRVTIPINLKNKDVEPKEYAAKRVLESLSQG
jgi:hypothetical protein